MGADLGIYAAEGPSSDAVALDSTRSPLAPTVLALAAVTFAAMLVTLSYGIWSGGLMDFRSASELCGGELAVSPTQSLLPLRNTCVFEDGSVRRLVPALVNPALVALLAVSGILTGCSAYLRRHAIALR
jgi:hypothetical protein